MEPVAIVGMAGRFPQAEDTAAFWRLLMAGRDVITEVPGERWDPAEVVDATHAIPSVGGFLDGIDQFDPAFFGISPREATVLDPQQRLMLEATWRALEDAGQRAADLRGTRTGVYMGGLWHDHELLRKERGEPATQHSIVGNSLDILSSRVSYFLGVTGPSLTVESSCSSSLVALHLACQALRHGEIDAALVGAANLMLSPDVTVGLTHFGGLSPTGRCRPFGLGADGFVRGEGVAALYLTRLDRAQRDGDRVRAVIVASAVNNDGGGASLVTPNPAAQADLLRRVYTEVPPDRIGYVEAHGTGTAQGDRAETSALGAVLGRPDGTSLPIGSVKSNIGHLEPAAGLAGLIKCVLSLENGVVPPSLNAEQLNPDIDFAALGLDVVRSPLALAADACVGVNSFGWGGTNAHVVLTTAPARDEPVDQSEGNGPYLLPLSGHSQEALRQRMAQAPRTRDMAQALAWHRDHFTERVGVVVDGDDHRQVPGRAREVGRVAFVFPGQGAQWPGMAAGLYGHDPAFTRAMDRCAEALSRHVDWHPHEVLTGTARLSSVDIVQPVSWAMSVSLAAAWQEAGVRPDVVIGHSQGEIAAATVAGALSYEDAALVVTGRSSVLREVAGRGRMLAVDLDREAATKALSDFEGLVSLAAHNGPRSCVLSGDTDAVLLLREILEADEVFCRLVDVDYASHSPQIDPLLPTIRDALRAVAPRPGTIPMLSTVDLRTLAGDELDAGYWAANLRGQVRFADAVDRVVAGGVTHLIEVSPHPGLAPALRQLAEGHEVPPVVLGTLRRDEGSQADLLGSFAHAYVHGLSPFGPRPRRRPPVTPPPYPWQRERFWGGDRVRTPVTARLALELLPSPVGASWQGACELSATAPAWLADHRVIDTCVFPAAGYLALVHGALNGRPLHLTEVTLPTALALTGEPLRLAGTWLPATETTGTITLSSFVDGSWTQHCRALVRQGGDPPPAGVFPRRLLAARAMSAEDFYRSCRERRLDYGPAFRPVDTVRVEGDEALVRIARTRGVPLTVLIDGVLQSALALVPPGPTVVPTAVGSVTITELGDGELWVHARRGAADDYAITAFDGDHNAVLRIDGLVLSALAEPAGARSPTRVHRMRFEPGEPPPLGAQVTHLVFGARAAELAALLPDARAATGVVGGDALVFLAPTDPAAQRGGLIELAGLVRESLRANPSASLAVVTFAAQPAPDGSPVDPGAALYTGLTTVLQAEFPQFRARLVDTDGITPALVTELASGDTEDVVVLRGERRWVGRRVRGGAAEADPPAWLTGDAWQPFRVHTRHPGRLDSLGRLALERRPPAQGQVEVAITAGSLNFIDVMKAMGVYPDTSADRDLLGLDGAGVITAIGPGVADLVPGQRVVACGFGLLASHATVDARHVLPLPEGLTPEQAAALPMAMVTAWYALIDIARVEPGETVLIHSGTGGLGLAAIAVARLAGAEILATAGTERKREYLRGLGIPHVFDSRGLDWAAGVRTATGGRGVDVVLNSLAGSAIPVGLDALADDGRFVELGKRDIYADAAFDLRAFRKAVTFAAVDIAALLRRRPDRFATLLRTVFAAVGEGRLAPLPVVAHGFDDAEGAFRSMSRGEHIGKLVLTEPERCATVEPDPRWRGDGTYVITGGLGALGLSLAEYLVAHGVGGVVLIGRTAPGEAVAARVAALGDRVLVRTVDVTDEAGMAAVLDEVRAALPAVRGVFHAVGVLDDATLPNLDPARLDRVLSAKIDGAAVLHRLTLADPIDVFVLFSSAAVFVGTAGQSAYAAANAWLDAFAVHRRRSGRAGLSVQWGPIRDVGLAAARSGRADRLADRGMPGVAVDECWPALRTFLDDAETVVGFLALDPRRWAQTYPAVVSMPSWRGLLEAEPEQSTTDGAAARLRALPVRRAEVVEDLVRRDAAAVLMIDAAGLDRDTPLRALGLDSLMAIELRNRLESSLGVRLTPTLLWKYGSLSRLGTALAGLLDEEVTDG